MAIVAVEHYQWYWVIDTFYTAYIIYIYINNIYTYLILINKKGGGTVHSVAIEKPKESISLLFLKF